jgi:hypothetical protein
MIRFQLRRWQILPLAAYRVSQAVGAKERTFAVIFLIQNLIMIRFQLRRWQILAVAAYRVSQAVGAKERTLFSLS